MSLNRTRIISFKKSLDILDSVKLVIFYHRCKLLYLTDIVPFIIQYILDTQQYVSNIIYEECFVPNIIIIIPTITKHTTHLIIQMLLYKYPNFNNTLKKHRSIIFTSKILITNCVINNNILILSLTLKQDLCYKTRFCYTNVPDNYNHNHNQNIDLGNYVLDL